jgi:hypothetical protein
LQNDPVLFNHPMPCGGAKINSVRSYIASPALVCLNTVVNKIELVAIRTVAAAARLENDYYAFTR